MRDFLREVKIRRFLRKPVILAATLETDIGTSDCVALDLSLGGARLRLAQRIGLREPATLVLSGFNKLPATVAWTTTTEIGLQFTESPEQVAGHFRSILNLSNTSNSFASLS
jgi:PilZ domain